MRRSREEIAVGILKSCTPNKLTISQLMAGQNLCYKVLMVHLRHLVTIRLIESEEIGRRRSFSTTESGMIAMRCYKNAVAQLMGNYSSCHLLPQFRSGQPAASFVITN